MSLDKTLHCQTFVIKIKIKVVKQIPHVNGNHNVQFCTVFFGISFICSNSLIYIEGTVLNMNSDVLMVAVCHYHGNVILNLTVQMVLMKLSAVSFINFNISACVSLQELSQKIKYIFQKLLYTLKFVF